MTSLTRLIPWCSGTALLLCLSAIAVEPVTLTDSSGRTISGQVEGMSDLTVRFRMKDRAPIEITLEKLSKESRELLETMRDKGEITAAAWPARAPLPSPYKFETEGSVWTGAHVRIEFPKPPESRGSSSPEAVFLKSIDTVIAAAKAFPMNLVEKDRIFECRVLPEVAFLNTAKMIEDRRKAKEAPQPKPAPASPFGPGRLPMPTVLRPQFNPLLQQLACYDEEKKILYFPDHLPAQFLEAKLGGYKVPMKERQNLVRRMAGLTAVSDKLDQMPEILRAGLAGYFETIGQVAGDRMIFPDVPRGLRELLKEDTKAHAEAKSENEEERTPPIDITAAASAILANKVEPKDTNSFLIAYYFLHLDHGGDASGAAAVFRSVAKGDSSIQSRIDEYNAALTDFQFKITDFNREVAQYNAKVDAHNLALKQGLGKIPEVPANPPVKPLEPPILAEFAKNGGVEALEKQAKDQAMAALYRGRTASQVADDLKAEYAKILK